MSVKIGDLVRLPGGNISIVWTVDKEFGYLSYYWDGELCMDIDWFNKHHRLINGVWVW